jgi:hypothetical protein
MRRQQTRVVDVSGERQADPIANPTTRAFFELFR